MKAFGALSAAILMAFMALAMATPAQAATSQPMRDPSCLYSVDGVDQTTKVTITEHFSRCGSTVRAYVNCITSRGAVYKTAFGPWVNGNGAKSTADCGSGGVGHWGYNWLDGGGGNHTVELGKGRVP